ncbi:hypothetical protein ACIP79_33805 [Streptomyces sp. NPDC088747]|uniref:hypothetical protein n=1 Tax=Streptomyces sp. NPDC088747 TaxID=3365886 RepID=UPI003829C54A
MNKIEQQEWNREGALACSDTTTDPPGVEVGSSGSREAGGMRSGCGSYIMVRTMTVLQLPSPAQLGARGSTGSVALGTAP